MKVILNKDLNPLGEEGDIKNVATGYYRNYLGPRGIALPYNDETAAMFEARKGKIEEKKKLKRQDAAAVKERIEALNITLTLPAGPNGKLYGAVTTPTVMDELAKAGFPTERKRIEIPGNVIKATGKYKIAIKLYEGAVAELNLTVEAQVSAHKEDSHKKPRHAKHEEVAEVAAEEAAAAEEAPVEEAAPEALEAAATEE
jgi:large subunit ribosomal protein L9